jgi:glycosyltransferase involved in cell wall biosynthesis
MDQTKKAVFLFLLPWLPKHVGGVNQVVISLARQLKLSGIFDPIILVTDWNAFDPVWEEFQGVKVVRWRIRAYRTSMGIKERIAYWFWERRFRIKFEKFCTQNEVKVLNMHYVGPIAFSLERFRNSCVTGIPLLLSFHGTDLTTMKTLSKSELSEWKELLSKVNAVVACSRNLGEKITEIFGELSALQVIHNGLDVATFKAGGGNPERPIERPYILSVGKFERQKGQDVLIEAFAEICSRHKLLNLIFVGATDTALPELKALCELRGISNKVHFHPDRPHSEMARFFRHAEIFVLPSRLEAFGIVLLEAGAFSLPVVATSVGGIPELIVDGLTGKLVPSDDQAAMALCIQSLLINPEESRRLGQKLFEHVSNEFTWRAAHDKYLSIV